MGIKYLSLRKRWIHLVFILVLLLFSISNEIASLEGANSSRFEQPSSQELENFLDPLFTRQMEELHIPGAVFVLVKDGEIFFQKGYGVADIEKQTPVNPEQTLFRVASISKLFTATAIMQLYEQQKLHLDDDVSQYLTDFQIEGNDLGSVTIANLLTHTGGFSQQHIGRADPNIQECLTLAEYLPQNMPPRVLPSGDKYIYSNHGFALAGYLVEKVSHITYEKYIQKNILLPLEMYSSGFVSSPHLKTSQVATGYVHQNGRYKPLALDCLHLSPAGGLIATASDIANFMIAHLQNGNFHNHQLLKAHTIQEMHQLQFTQHPEFSGFGYGFRRSFYNGKLGLWHDGRLNGFISLLYLLPEEDLGIFISYNSDQPELQRTVLLQFLDHYYPARSKDIIDSQPNVVVQPSTISGFRGYYRNVGYSHDTIEKLLALLQVKVTVNDDNFITISYPVGDTLTDATGAWVLTDRFLFEKVDGSINKLAFQTTADNATFLFIQTSAGLQVFEKVLWYETYPFHLGLLLFCVLSFVWSLLYQLQCIYRLYSQPRVSIRKDDFYLNLVASLISGFKLMFLLGLILIVRSYTLFDFTYGLPNMIIYLLYIPLLTTLSAFLMMLFVAVARYYKRVTIPQFLHGLFLGFVSLVFFCFLLYWNVL